MRRLLLMAVVSCLALTAPAAATTIAVPPPQRVHFDLGPGVGSKVTTYAYGADQRMEVVRQGQVVAQSTGTSGGRGTVMTPGLVAGDVANVYVSGTLRFSATFDGTPTIDGACVGRSSFTFTRGTPGSQWRAGVMTPLDYPRDGSVPFGAERTDGPLTIPVALTRPLALGDYAYAATGVQLQSGTFVLSSRIIVVDACPAPPAITPAAKPALRDAARKLRALRRTAKRLTLPMRFTEPGTIRLRLTAAGRPHRRRRQAHAHGRRQGQRDAQGHAPRRAQAREARDPHRHLRPDTAGRQDPARHHARAPAMKRLLSVLGFAWLVAAAPAAASSTLPPFAIFTAEPTRGAQVYAYAAKPAAVARIEIVRQGVVVAEASEAGRTRLAGARVRLRELIAGDVAKLYADGALVLSVNYDGTPVIGPDACLGRSAFTVTHSGRVMDAGLLTISPDYPEDVGWGWGVEQGQRSGTNPVTVTLARPLAAGDVAYARTEQYHQGLNVYLRRGVQVGACPPTDAQVAAAARASRTQAASKLRTLRLTRAKRFTLPVTYSEPGTYRLRVVARGRTIADGRRTRAVAGKANVTLKVLRRARTKRVTLVATFTPSRAGAEAQSARTTLRLR